VYTQCIIDILTGEDGSFKEKKVFSLFSYFQYWGLNFGLYA
jgi:hypothetical protein